MKDLAKWRALFLLTSATAIGALWSHDKLEIFLNPRYAAPLPWGALVLLAMGLVELVGLRSKAAVAEVKFRHIVWFLPLVVGLAVRPSGISGNFAGSRGPTAAGRMISQADRFAPLVDSMVLDRAAPTEIDSFIQDSVASVAGDSDWIAPLVAAKSHPLLRPMVQTPPETADNAADAKPRGRASIWCELPLPDGTVCVDTLRERFWYEQMLAMYMDPKRHRGRRMRLVGMALRDASVEAEGWHVGRMMIWCCAADASPLGLHPIGKPTGEPLVEGAWVAIEGTLDMRIAKLPGMSKPREIPVLLHATVSAAQAPHQENVFPFSY